MLLALHAATAWGIDEPWARGFFLAHVGLFLLWQPLWRGERSIGTRDGLLVVAGCVGLAAAAGWWVLTLWLALIFGLFGGRATGSDDRRSRVVLLVAAAYVLALLLAWVVPHLLGTPQPEERLASAVRYGLAALPVAILFMPAPAREHGAVVIDLFYAALLFLMVLVLVLGSIVLNVAAAGGYGYALMQMLFGLAVLLAVLSWLWNPHAGYAGAQQLVSRYVAGVGMPFERWVAYLGELAAAVPGSREFAQHGLEEMRRTARLAGVAWRHGAIEVTLGAARRDALHFDVRGQAYVLYPAARPAPGMMLHLKRLTEAFAYFYEAKRREERERDDAYQRAIHETGARLTHDMKNLLQALRGLCAAAEEAGPADDAALVALFRRQLPAVTARLDATVERLRGPAGCAATEMPAQVWWRALQGRYEGQGVAFRCDGRDEACVVPAELFDGVAENLIANALAKSDPSPRVGVAFDGRGAGRLEVTDDGAPVPEDVARRLLHERVASGRGLGVGLYHCAQHAKQLGYDLALMSNAPGSVRFVLSRANVTAIAPR